jgi:ribonucleoside-diphosphate reductase alpha chain
MGPVRKRLSPERPSITRVFRLPYTHKNGDTDTMHFYFTVGMYDDGQPGEIFIKADKTGSLASGSLDQVGIMMSMMLQYGVPLEDVIAKLRGTRFPPNGWTGDHEIKSCSSPLDLLAQWLKMKFIEPEPVEPEPVEPPKTDT